MAVTISSCVVNNPNLLLATKKKNGREKSIHEGVPTKIITTNDKILKGKLQIVNDSSLAIGDDIIDIQNIDEISKYKIKRGAYETGSGILMTSAGSGMVYSASMHSPRNDGVFAGGVVSIILGSITSIVGIVNLIPNKQLSKEKWDFDVTNRWEVIENRPRYKRQYYNEHQKSIKGYMKKNIYKKEIVEYGLQDGDTLVDIGCGHGAIDVILSYYYPNMFFILEDILDFKKSINHSYKIKDKEINLKDKSIFYVGTNDSIPLPSSRYKYILCRLTVHEFTNPSAMVKELKRILAPNGELIIVEKNLRPGVREAHTGLIMPSCTEIIELFKANGFELIMEKPILCYAYDYYSNKFSYPCQIILKFTK